MTDEPITPCGVCGKVMVADNQAICLCGLADEKDARIAELEAAIHKHKLDTGWPISTGPDVALWDVIGEADE